MFRSLIVAGVFALFYNSVVQAIPTKGNFALNATTDAPTFNYTQNSSCAISHIPDPFTLKLNITTYNPQNNSNFAVSSNVLVSGDDLVIVDAQFEKSNAQKVADIAKATGKKPKLIFVSHSDPDYYFGLNVLHKAFPDAKIYATAATVQAIKNTYKLKEKTWYPQMGDEKPDAIIIPEPIHLGPFNFAFNVGIHPVFIKGIVANRTQAWIPTAGTILGGVNTDANEHVWLADTKSLESRRHWIEELEILASYYPSTVIPGHYTNFTDGSTPRNVSSAIEFPKKYIQDFNEADKKSKNSTELVAIMKKKYPNLEGLSSLELSAKVIKNEMPWP